nr:bile acid:sodium symporter family protein [uncultured Rhodopila sp.]
MLKIVRNFFVRLEIRLGSAAFDVGRTGLGRPIRFLAQIDRFVLFLALTIVAATILPCRGATATSLHYTAVGAVSSLFFLQGARLPRGAVVNGIMHWRLHIFILSVNFVMFPLFGIGLWTAFPSLLPDPLWLGVIFACTLPSTVQSSIALTSIAGGNVAGAVCSAALSNVMGFILTPIIFGAIVSIHATDGLNVSGIGLVALQLLVPFITGHLMRPWIGALAERNRFLLSITDRGSILLVNYVSFSGAVVHGIWLQVPCGTLASLFLVTGVLLAAVLLCTMAALKAFGFERQDEVAALLCGSQKSLVSGVPIANVLFSAGAIGPVLLPIMIYYPVQIVVGSLIAKWHRRSGANDVAVGPNRRPV